MAEYPVPITEALLQEITHRLVEAFAPEKVILFGSRAAETPHADSDVDLLVIMEAQAPPIQRAVAVKSPTRADFEACSGNGWERGPSTSSRLKGAPAAVAG